MADKRDNVKVMVAVVDANGEPDFFFCKVNCSEAEINDGEHYEAARALAAKEGYEVRLVLDEMDRGGKAIEHVFEWDSATVVDLADGYLRADVKPKMSF